MRFLNISKGTGWLIVPFIVAIFVLLFRNRFIRYYGVEPPWNWSTQMALVGAFLTQVAYIQAGTTASLTFFGKKLRTKWEDGISPLPNFFHISLKWFTFSVLWGLLPFRQSRYELENFDRNMNVDNRRTARVIQANVTPMQMAVIQLLNWIFVGWMDLPVHLRISAFGFRIMLAGVICTLANAGVPKF